MGSDLVVQTALQHTGAPQTGCGSTSFPHHQLGALNPSSVSIPLLHFPVSEPPKRANAKAQASEMINAFLVFNGQGQPRLTKFYTQLVSRFRASASTPLPFPASASADRMLRALRTQVYNNA